MITCVNEAVFELTIKKSRFIAVSKMIESRDDAKEMAARLKAEHIGARHVCFGFIADEKGDDFGYDDDGEPSGTAGKPIYSALAAVGARKSAVAVVRYFGGIKLGAGGLTRAYRESAAGVISQGGLVTAQKYAVYEIATDSETFKKATAVMRNIKCDVDNIYYGSAASCTAAVATDGESALVGALSALGVTPIKRGEQYRFSTKDRP